MKTKYSYRRTISLVVLTFFVMLSCSKKDDSAVETITYKDDLDGTGWVVGFNKTGTLSNCIERENLDIDEELATDMTGVEFQDSTMKLIADYTEICPDESRDSWAYASKEFNEINLDPATTKQVTIKYERNASAKQVKDYILEKIADLRNINSLYKSVRVKIDVDPV